LSRIATAEGVPAWFATSYDVVSLVLTDSRFGVSPPGTGYQGNNTLFQDGPAHTRLRKCVSGAFGARRVSGMAEGVSRSAAELVTRMAASGPPADFVALVAAPMSASVIADLLGIGAEDHLRFRDCADAALMSETSDGGAAAMRGFQELTTYAAELVAAKRRQPGVDLISSLIDRHLADDELVGMIISFVGGGYVSTRNAIAVAVIQLLTEGRLSAVAVDGAGSALAMEEVLRRQAGLTGNPLPRWARQDLVVNGRRVAAGDMILIALEGANRDPARFADAAALRTDRAPNPHLAFGRGPHHCPGAALARLEIGAVMRALARQVPGVSLAGPVDKIDWRRGHADAGPLSLWVTW
jgi:cytochrome P450